MLRSKAKEEWIAEESDDDTDFDVMSEEGRKEGWRGVLCSTELKDRR